MRVVDIEDFRANMEELIEGLKPGDSFLLSVEGIPKVQVIALTDADRERLCKKRKPNPPGSGRRTTSNPMPTGDELHTAGF
jgi:hypothetical protein